MRIAAGAAIAALVGVMATTASGHTPPQGVNPSVAPVMVDDGAGPDGARYEWTAYRAQVEIGEGGTTFDAMCEFFDMPARPAFESMGSCEGEGEPAVPSVLRSALLHGSGVPPQNVMLAGSTNEQPHSIDVLYTDASGQDHDLTVDFKRVDGELLASTGGDEAFGVFTAFVPEAQIAHRAAKCVRAAEKRAARGKPGGRRVKQRCGRLGRSDIGLPCSPFEITAYDEQGRVVETDCIPLLPVPPAD
jgi:hypothetical protein